MDKTDDAYALLWMCFTSEQMSVAELVAFMTEDQAFKAYADARLSERRRYPFS